MAGKREKIVAEAQRVIKQYTTRLTIRQIYYRLVSVHMIENKATEYQAVVKALKWARLNDVIPYDNIEDRTRAFIGGDHEEDTPDNHFETAKSYLENCWKYFKYPRWLNQPNYVEVWLEKQALAALFEQVTDDLKVRLAPCRGYPSLTFLWEGSRHLNRVEDKEIKILYFGDFDPSGLDIPRYIEQRFTEDLGIDTARLSFEKIAITQEQISQYDIPPMPAKTTDSRSAKFIEEHGSVSAVELDALDPNVLQKLIREAIGEYFDEAIGGETMDSEAAAQQEIRGMIAKSLKKAGKRSEA